jgi:spore coat protein CotH
VECARSAASEIQVDFDPEGRTIMWAVDESRIDRGPGRGDGPGHLSALRGPACVLAALALLALPVAAQRPGASPPGGFGGRGGGGGGGVQPELAVVERFDVDGNGRLDRDERREARAWLAQQPRPGGRGGAGGAGGRGGGPGGRGIVPASPGPGLAPADVAVHADARLYEPEVLRTFFIDFEGADWEEEMEAFFDTDVDVPATVRVDGELFEQVGLGFRGASSYRMVPSGSKRSLKLRFDHADDDQDLYGYQTLNLLNANNDPTFLRTVLYSEIARRYLPAPQVNYVRVVINGESWGVYANQQQFNNDFLDDFFGTRDGARWQAPGSPNGRAGLEYLGDDLAAYRRLYEIKTDDDPERWADLVELTRVLNETAPDALEAALEPILDVDGALRFLAVEMALVNSDGYWTRASDYNLYQDPDGRFHVIPHDMNEALGAGAPGGGGGRAAAAGGGRAGVPGGGRTGAPGGGRGGGPGAGGATVDPLTGLDDATKPLRSRLLAVPALRQRYLGYVKDIAERWLDPEAMAPVLDGYRARIAEDVRTDTRKLYATEAFETGYADLLRFMGERRTYLLEYGG